MNISKTMLTLCVLTIVGSTTAMHRSRTAVAVGSVCGLAGYAMHKNLTQPKKVELQIKPHHWVCPPASQAFTFFEDFPYLAVDRFNESAVKNWDRFNENWDRFNEAEKVEILEMFISKEHAAIKNMQ